MISQTSLRNRSASGALRVCSLMLTHVCSRMLTYAHVCWGMQARAQAPCIVFIDEIDAVGRARGRGGAGSVCSRMLTYAHVCVAKRRAQKYAK